MAYVALFDREKFKELVLYVAQKCAQDPGFGATRLNKALWWADFQAFARLGRPITGAHYMHLPQGPVPKLMLGVLEELRAEKAIYDKTVPTYGGYEQKRVVARRTADTTMFSPEELRLVDQVLRALTRKRAKGVSTRSHQKSAGWRLTIDKETIPYETVFVSARRATPADRAWARGVAQKHDWL